MKDTDTTELQDLVLVAGHAVLREPDPGEPENDNAWALLSFQPGEPVFYIEHV